MIDGELQRVCFGNVPRVHAMSFVAQQIRSKSDGGGGSDGLKISQPARGGGCGVGGKYFTSLGKWCADAMDSSAALATLPQGLLIVGLLLLLLLHLLPI